MVGIRSVRPVDRCRGRAGAHRHEVLRPPVHRSGRRQSGVPRHDHVRLDRTRRQHVERPARQGAGSPRRPPSLIPVWTVTCRFRRLTVQTQTRYGRRAGRSATGEVAVEATSGEIPMPKLLRPLAIALLAVASLVAGVAPASSITGGTEDTSNQYSNVGMVVFYQPDGRF